MRRCYTYIYLSIEYRVVIIYLLVVSIIYKLYAKEILFINLNLSKFEDKRSLLFKKYNQMKADALRNSIELKNKLKGIGGEGTIYLVHRDFPAEITKERNRGIINKTIKLFRKFKGVRDNGL